MDDTALEENGVQRSETPRSRRADRRVEGLPQNTGDTTSPTPPVEAALQQHIIRIRVGVLIMCLFFGMHPILTNTGVSTLI